MPGCASPESFEGCECGVPIRAVLDLILETLAFGIRRPGR